MTWLVIGAGVSGLGAVKWLRHLGESVRVSDGKTLEPESAAAFRTLGADLRDGGHDLSHLDGITDVVLSPGLPPTHPLVVEARHRGLRLISEIDLALRSYKGRVIGVTGTNGKSTTCAMLGYVLEQAGVHVAVGGNFGDPPTAMMAEGRAGDVLVLELSSYQLEQSDLIAPDAAVFTSFSYDHLARHGTLSGYFLAKWRLFQSMRGDGCIILPDYVHAEALAQGLPFSVQLTVIGRDILIENGGLSFANGMRIELTPLGIIEPQNQLNAAFALLCAAKITGKTPAELAHFLRGFRGLPHRCERIGTLRGCAVINDSKSTNVESTLAALAGQATPVLLLMGGQGKGEPYGPILAERSRIAAVVTFGASGGEIASALSQSLTVHEFPTLKDALAAIPGILERTGPVPLLLSPGCASFDEFQNFEHRGRAFTAAMTAAGMSPA